MTYSIIQPPFTLQFRMMSKKELASYAAWYHGIMAERIVALTEAVRTCPEYELWNPDASPESLVALDRWYEGQVETRKKTEDELGDARAKLTFAVDLPDVELTNRTFSLAMDIGMYFGRVVLENVPGTRWSQLLNNKRLADYGQPVIIGAGEVPLNPTRIAVTMAYGSSRNKPGRLRELYDTWAKMLR